MSNIFDKPTTNSTSATKTKTEFMRIQPKDINQDDLFEMIEEFDEIGTQTKKLTSRINIIKGNLRKIAVSEYIGKYETDEKNPGSVIIEAINDDGDIGEFLFVPSDRYISIKTGKEADELEEKYGKGLVERNITYSFDPEMFDKYTKVISNLIENCDDIEEEDKSKLFVASESYKVVSGTINELHSLSNSNVRETFEGLKPVVSLKNAQVIKS